MRSPRSAGTVSKAVGFTMPGASYDLGSITLRLMEQAGSTDSLSVQLYGGVDNPSGPVLAQFNSPAIPNVASDVVFTPTAPFTLKANDTYWIYVAGTSNTLDGIVWYASTPGIPPSGVATAAGARFSSKGAGVSSLSPSSVMNTFQVTGTLIAAPAVPEPSSSSGRHLPHHPPPLLGWPEAVERPHRSPTMKS